MTTLCTLRKIVKNIQIYIFMHFKIFTLLMCRGHDINFFYIPRFFTVEEEAHANILISVFYS